MTTFKQIVLPVVDFDLLNKHNELVKSFVLHLVDEGEIDNKSKDIPNTEQSADVTPAHIAVSNTRETNIR